MRTVISTREITCDRCITQGRIKLAYYQRVDHSCWKNLCEEHYQILEVDFNFNRCRRIIYNLKWRI